MVWPLIEDCDDVGESATCDEDCSFVECGDGTLNKSAGEVCDDTDLNGETCESLGFLGGALGCADDCGYYIFGCALAGMVQVPGGVFLMGSDAYPNERPARNMNVDAFFIDETEVTVEAYAVCVAGGGCTAPGTGATCNWGVPGREDHPVNCVSWFDAENYCGWVDSGTKRLPTEAEWEKAARGTDARTHPWGDEPEPSCSLVVMHDAAAGGSGCGIGSTWPVGSKPLGESPYGSLDMAGNVHEWVADWYGDYDPEETDNSTGPARGSVRVLRGGSWDYDFTGGFRAAGRFGVGPTNYSNLVGFRCARTP